MSTAAAITSSLAVPVVRCSISFNIPSLFPASRPFIASSEQGLLLPYLSNTLK